MPTQLWVPGPAQIAVGTGALGVAEFLGYSEDGIRAAMNARFEDVHTDNVGPGEADDVQTFGQGTIISLTLTRFDAAVFNKLMTRKGTGTPGTIDAGDIGALMRHEGRSIVLWIRAPYSTKDEFAGMVAGYRFPTAWVNDSIDLPMSVRVQRPRITFRAIPDWQSDGSGVLYDNDMTDFPALS
jgi:hypothetical protein